MKKQMTDEEILEERGNRYGPIVPMWESIGLKQWENFQQLNCKVEADGRPPTKAELAHLAAMNMEMVKITRSIEDPTHMDNYQDGRNYWTIAAEVSS